MPPGGAGRKRTPLIVAAAVAVIAIVAVALVVTMGGKKKHAAAPKPKTADPLLVHNIDQATNATIRVINGDYSGSAFFITSGGLAVTNNHVVAGGGSLSVHIGDAATSYRAVFVADSECSDLAVIQVEGLPKPVHYFPWATAPTKRDLSVRVLGYPEDQVKLTSGTISEPPRKGATKWASVDSEIEFSATIDHGNSGGPVFDDKFRVVGVSYAGVDGKSDQNFGIDHSLAQPVVQKLVKRQVEGNIGISGDVSEDQWGDLNDGDYLGEPGMYVDSVASGSPADKAGIQTGDIITKIGGDDVVTHDEYQNQDASTWTAAHYCDAILGREHDSLPVTVYRNGETLTGSINGDALTSQAGLNVRLFREAMQKLPEGTAIDPDTGYTNVAQGEIGTTADIPKDWHVAEVQATTDHPCSVWAAASDEDSSGTLLIAKPGYSSIYIKSCPTTDSAADVFQQNMDEDRTHKIGAADTRKDTLGVNEDFQYFASAGSNMVGEYASFEYGGTQYLMAFYGASQADLDAYYEFKSTLKIP